MKLVTPHHLNRKFKHANGFTLIELLVVVAIIALLAAILFPAFARARENARRASCQSNLKQIGIGMLQYAQDYDETMVSQYWVSSNNQNVPTYATSPLPNWIVSLQPYIKSWQVFVCPSAQATQVTGLPGYTVVDVGNPSDSNYAANGVIVGRKLAAISGSSQIIAVQEMDYRWGATFIRPAPADSIPYPVPLTDTLFEGNYNYGPDSSQDSEHTNILHFGGGNLLYMDGHVKWQNQNSVTPRVYGLNSDTNNFLYTTTYAIDTSQITG